MLRRSEVGQLRQLASAVLHESPELVDLAWVEGQGVELIEQRREPPQECVDHRTRRAARKADLIGKMEHRLARDVFAVSTVDGHRHRRIAIVVSP